MRSWSAGVVFVVLWCVVVSAQQAVPRPRTIRTVRMPSETLGDVRTFGLLLPPDYDQTTRRYPVLYLLHGSGQQHSTWGRPALLANTTGTIVVMPDNGRTRYRGEGSLDARIEQFVVNELVDYVDATYRTIATRDGRAIGGLSIGGFGAMWFGLRHADRFGAIGSFSGPLDGIGDPQALLQASAVRPSIYISCGVADSLLGSSRRFAALLESQRVERRYEEGPGGHTWASWDWQLRSFLKTLPWPA